MRPTRSEFRPDAKINGMGLIDVVLVMTITLVLGAIAIPQFLRITYDTQLRNSAAELADLMQRARMSAARANATYPVRFTTTNNLQQIYIDINNSGSPDTNEPSLTLPSHVVGASGAPDGTGGNPTAYTLVGDSTSGTPFDNSNLLAYSPRGLPCNYITSTSTCATPAASYFVYYLRNDQNKGWSAVLVTKSGRTKALMWNGAGWK
jgi:Tfp pilus assembly protein FimT